MHFPTTRWTLLAEATLSGDHDGCRALETLCASYRQPILNYLAFRGYAEHEREDLAQEFFLRWLRSRSWKRADAGRGRFRTFLLGCLGHMLSHHHRQQSALKRGGHNRMESLELLLEGGWEAAEEDGQVSNSTFDRDWAATLVGNALRTLEQEYAERGSTETFVNLRHFLPSGGEVPSLEKAAVLLKMNPAAVKSALHRLRGRFRELLRMAVAATVSGPHEVEDELRHLRMVLLLTAAHASSEEKK